MLKPSLNDFAEEYAEANGFGKFSNLLEHMLVNLKRGMENGNKNNGKDF